MGFYAEVDMSKKTLPNKVRQAQVAQWNYIAVVGDAEMSSLSVTLRARGAEKPLGNFSLSDLMKKFDEESRTSSEPLRCFEAFDGRMPEAVAATAAEPSAPKAAAPKGAAAPSAKAAAAKSPPKPQQKNMLQLRKQGSKQFADLTVDDCVEDFLEDHPYVKGYVPSKADLELFDQISESHLPETPNLRRWFDHIQSFAKAERESWA